LGVLTRGTPPARGRRRFGARLLWLAGLSAVVAWAVLSGPLSTSPAATTAAAVSSGGGFALSATGSPTEAGAPIDLVFTFTAVGDAAGHVRMALPATWPNPGPAVVDPGGCTLRSVVNARWPLHLDAECTDGAAFTVGVGGVAPKRARTWSFTSSLTRSAQDVLSLAVPAVIVAPGPIAKLDARTPAATKVGRPLALTVAALDAFGNVVPDYAGTVDVTSSDPAATLPLPYTYLPADGGRHVFTGIRMGTGGFSTITATDAVATLSRTLRLTVVPGPTLFVASNGAAPGPGAAITFHVGLFPPSPTEVTVDYATEDATATVGAGDYVPTAGRLHFAAGQTAATVTVPIRATPLVGTAVAFRFVLSNPSIGAALPKTAVLGVITAPVVATTTSTTAPTPTTLP